MASPFPLPCTRYSPLNLGSRHISVSKADYELTMSCRMASQRGLRPRDVVTSDKALELQEILVLWSHGISEDVKADVRQQISKSKN